MVTFADVERFACGLPETTSSPSYGFPGLKVNKSLFARLRGEMLDELDPVSGAPYGEILMVTVADLGEKEALLADDPGVYFTVPHYDGYAAVLVRLSRVDEEELHELLLEAWLRKAPKRAVKAYVDQGGELPD